MHDLIDCKLVLQYSMHIATYVYTYMYVIHSVPTTHIYK